MWKDLVKRGLWREWFQYWWKKQLAVLAAFGAVLGFIDAFGVIPEKFGFLFLFLTLLVSVIVASIWAVVDYRKDQERGTGTDTIIKDREGSRRSLSEQYEDTCHRILSILRQDMLDYASDDSLNGRDFVSFRIIKGVNVSKRPTDGFIYFECTEYKCRYKDIKIRAKDVETGEELRVEFLNLNPSEKYFEFPFKIYFRRQLNPDETFHIAFFIDLLNELDVLKKDGEYMSISLSRYLKGVEELQFNVCLNFKPSAVTAEYIPRGLKDKFFLHSSPVIIEEYVPETDLEKEYNIQWSEPPYIIRWKCSNPKHLLYAIKYRKIEAS